MAAEIGSSVGNNQAALEEQRKKQQEEAAKKAQETSASSDTATSEKTSEKTNENSKQTDTGNKENPLSIQRPGTTDTSQTKETSNKLETDPNKISPLLPDLNKSSEKLSTKDLIASITEKIEKTQARIDTNLFNQSNNPNSAAEHIASRPDTLAFAAQQVRIEASRNREEQLKLDDDRHSQAAYQEVKNHAEKLIKDGKENEARKVLRQVIDKPETLRSLARDVMAQRLSPETINLKSLANLDSGRSETVAKMQATKHSQMTKDDHQNHTLELISGLVEKLDESAETFIRNKEMLNALINPKISESKDYINPFAELTQEPKNSTQKPKNLFELNINLPSKSESKTNPEDRFSMLHRLGQRPGDELIQKEIKDREALKETLIQQREVQLRAQANLTKLALSGKADQIHLLFDGKGNPLSTETLKDRGSYNSGLPNELESKYRELNDFLKKDPSLEEGFAAMQDSLIGLSPEEQTVRARDFLTENLQAQRETLRLLQGINPNLNSIINDKNSSAIESLITIDQRTISQLTQETLSRRTDLMLELHDQLTENLNSGDFQKTATAIEKTQKNLKDEVYTYRNNKLSDYELKNRDLARTPKEDEEIQQRITALEEKFKALTDDQLNIVRGNMSNIDDHLKEFKSLNEPVPLGLFQEKGWRVVGEEADIRLQSIESLQKHTERVLDNLLSQQRNIKDAHEHMTESQQVERYERRLEEIISQTSSKYQGAGAQASHDGENIRRRLDGLDNFYGNTETGLKFTKNAALIAGATLATGGAGGLLIRAGWGLTESALAAGGIGTAYGAGVSLLSNSAEGVSRYGNGFNNPFKNVLSQTWKETKMSASAAFSTATGMNLTRGLSAFTQAYKWGRYAPNVSKVASSTIGGGASGFVSTNLSYGLDAAEKKITTGNFDFNNEQYVKDLLWNTGAATVGGFIGGTFGQLQNATSNATTRFGLIATEELASIAADLKITHARDGKITAEGLLQTFQASITGRTQAHFAAQNTSRPRNDLAQQIRNQETVVKSSGKLPDGVEAQTKVRVEPDGSRKVEVDAKEDLMRRAMNGDVEAQKKMLEETVAHARENPIDPQVKQADGSYKTMSTHQYQALRARQELAMRSVAEAKFADAQGSNVSATKQDSKTVLAEMNKAIKNGDFTRALELAEAKGVGEAYRKQFEADYEYNANRDRTKDALEQTSFSTTQTKEIDLKVGELEFKESETLDKAHIDKLQKESGLSKEALEKAGIKTVEFGDYGKAISIPYRNIKGEVIGHQIRLDNDTIQALDALPKDQLPEGLGITAGTVAKYQEASNLRGRPYYAKNFDPDSNNAIVITEGAKKAIKISDSIETSSQVVGLNGVGNLKSFLDDMGSKIKDKKIFLTFDGDTATNPKVKASQIDVIIQLTKAGADVRVVDIPLNRKNPKESGIDELLVSLKKEHSIDSHTAMKMLLDNADQQGPIRNLEELKRKVELWQKEQLSATQKLEDVIIGNIKRPNFAQDLENSLNPNNDAQKIIADFVEKASGLGKNFLESIDTNLNKIKALAQEIKELAQDPVSLDTKTNLRLVEELRSQTNHIQQKFNEEFNQRLQEAIDESSRSLIAINKNSDYKTLKDKSLELENQIKSLKDNPEKKQEILAEMKALRSHIAAIEAQATKPIDDLLAKVPSNLRPNDLSLISWKTKASEVALQINKVNLLEKTSSKESRATLSKVKAELETIHAYKLKQENRSTNSDIENKILDVARDYGSEDRLQLSQLERSKTYESLMKLLNEKDALIKNLQYASKSIGYDYQNEITSFVDNLHRIREVQGVGKLIDSIDRQLASQKGRSKEEVNPKALFGLLREAAYSKKLLDRGFDISEISAGNSFNHEAAVLNFKGQDVFRNVNYRTRDTILESLISEGLANPSVDKSARFIPLDLRQAGSDGKERFLAMDSFTGQIVTIKDLKPLEQILFETREGTQHYNQVEIDSIVTGEMVQNSNHRTNLVEYKLDLETFVNKNLMHTGMSWGEPNTKASFTDEPFLSGELLQIEKQLLIAKHFDDNLSIAMDLKAIQTKSGQIDQSSPLYNDTKKIFDYLEAKYGFKVGERLSIYDSSGIDRTIYFR